MILDIYRHIYIGKLNPQLSNTTEIMLGDIVPALRAYILLLNACMYS